MRLDDEGMIVETNNDNRQFVEEAKEKGFCIAFFCWPVDAPDGDVNWEEESRKHN